MSDNTGIDLLLVEDNPGDARLIRHHLRSDTSTVFDPPDVTHVESLSAGIDRLATGEFDILLLDLGLEESHGLETLERLNERVEAGAVAPLPVVVLTGLTDDETALGAIEKGAQDYLLKDQLDGAMLERAIRYALERHRQEQRLKRQNERLERFASIVSHDLRNPLNVARGRLAQARTEGADTAHLGEVDDALDRMETLVDDLLTLAREGRQVDEFESVDIADLAEQAWRNVEAPASELDVEVSGTTQGDETRLTQLFENLFRNSVEHGSAAPERPEGVTVTVGPTPEGFYVADDGTGIPESERADVFESGYSTATDGTGLGLDIVRDVAEAHGWEVELTENVDGGARFDISGPSLDGG